MTRLDAITVYQLHAAAEVADSAADLADNLGIGIDDLTLLLERHGLIIERQRARRRALRLTDQGRAYLERMADNGR